MRFQVDFNQKLMDLEGHSVRAGIGSPAVVDAINAATLGLSAEMKKELGQQLDEVFGKEETLSSIVTAGLLGAYEDERNLGDQERMRRYELARRVSKGGTRTFNTEERDLMKKMVGKRFLGSLIAPTVWELLEGAERVEELKEVGQG